MPDVNVTLEDRVEGYWKSARVLRVLGWTSIVWGCMIAIYIGTGLKAGSDMWLIWTLIQFVVGVICLAAGGWLDHLASRALASARLVSDNRERVA